MMNNNQQINQMLQFMTNGGNPQQFMEMFAQQNPKFIEAYNFMKNQASSNKMSMEQVAMNIAKQNGIDTKYLSQIASAMTRK